MEKPVEPSADKSKLEKFYKDCLAYYKETNHSKENWQKYQTVLADVKAVLENENATQDEVDNALKVLVEITGILNKELEDAAKSRQHRQHQQRLTEKEIMVEMAM